MLKHLICFSGGHSSGLVALEVAEKFGTENMILLNHDISKETEHEDIKRFKKELADYLGLKITYANYKNNIVTKNQFDISLEKKGFAIRTNVITPICTVELKTKPFHDWLINNSNNYIIYYGFDSTEKHRIIRRQNILKNMGYHSDYPLALWYKEDIDIYNNFDGQLNFIENIELLEPKFTGNRKFYNTNQIGIKPPLTYSKFKHANCIGCIRAGKQHWYIVYCLYPDIFERAKTAEIILKHSIIKNSFLHELENLFEEMKLNNIEPNENIESSKFWHNVKKVLKKNTFDIQDLFSCSIECIA